MSALRYSQNDEERVILRVLDGIENGLVVDVGAYDGLTYSNSRRLIELGWSAVLIEPEPNAFGALQSLYAENPRVTLIRAALARTCGETRLLTARRTPDHHALFTTTNAREAEAAALRHAVRFDATTCPALDWSTLLARIGRDAHFISIDTEGTSIDRLLELDLRALPNLRLICVERDFRLNGSPDPVSHDRAVRFAANNFFRLVHETPENLLFARHP